MGRDWAEDVIDNPWLLRKGLTDLAWDQVSIEEFAERYQQIVSSNLPRIRMVDRINELLGRRRYIAEEEWLETVRVPLYRFGAPKVEGACVSYHERDSDALSWGWWLKVFGIGTGRSRELTVTRTTTYRAAAGTCKMVYVPVRLRMSRVALYEGDRFINHGVKGEVAIPRNGNAEMAFSGRGCAKIRRGVCWSDVGDVDGEPLMLALSGDKSGVIHSTGRHWETDVSREVSLTLSKVIPISANAKVRRTRQLGLEFELPAGHNYLGHFGEGGFWWERP